MISQVAKRWILESVFCKHLKCIWRSQSKTEDSLCCLTMALLWAETSCRFETNNWIRLLITNFRSFLVNTSVFEHRESNLSCGHRKPPSRTRSPSSRSLIYHRLIRIPTPLFLFHTYMSLAPHYLSRFHSRLSYSSISLPLSPLSAISVSFSISNLNWVRRYVRSNSA